MNVRRIALPEGYQTRIEAVLQRLGYDLEKPGRLADSVMKLSDYYTENGEHSTPWEKPWAQVAQLVYYFPLNYARNLAVVNEATRLGFFTGLDTVIDIGSGLGSSLFAVLEQHSLRHATANDISQLALETGRQIQDPRLNYQIRSSQSEPLEELSATSLLSASYVLTELAEFPSQWHQAEALMLVEPATEQDGRKLLQTRQILIDKGYHIWAPCTHQGNCPLLAHSKTDWCHDRIHWQGPKWWASLEKLLPMQNRSLAFSYLLARKSKAPPRRIKSLARLTGDMLVEKGKTRQSVCRGEDREFLAWFPQRIKADLNFQRGSLIELLVAPQKKSNELRITEDSIVEINASLSFLE